MNNEIKSLKNNIYDNEQQILNLNNIKNKFEV